MNPNLTVLFSKSNLPTIKDVTYIIDIDEYKSIGTYWITFRVNG